VVLRHDAVGVLALGQPAHAWLCGQFARAWGNERFAAPDPLDDVVLGAEQHDLGWAVRDLAPVFNPETGLPQTFLETPPEVSFELWRHGPPRLVSQSRWSALLATMHGRRLSALRDPGSLTPDGAAVVETLRDESRERETQLIASLDADPETVARDSDLLWFWDALSLGLLLDWAPRTFAGVPSAGDGAVEIELRAVAQRDGLPTLALDPWPFADPDGIVVHTEGRRLDGRYDSAAELDAAWERAAWEAVRFALVPVSAREARLRRG
jgi:Protein of unknown function (DUF3891)